jgi:hypothetical protein
MGDGRYQMMADRIIRAIMDKLEANRTHLAKANSGQVTWRIKDDEVEVFIQPKI